MSRRRPRDRVRPGGREGASAAQRCPPRRVDRHRQAIVKSDPLQRAADRRGLAIAAPCVQPCRHRVPHAGGQPVARGQRAMRPRLDHAGCLRAFVGIRRPGAVESPHTRHAPEMRCRKADGDARTIAHPAPAGRPDFALPARARHRDVHLAAGDRARRGAGPLDCPMRRRGDLDNDDVDGGEAVGLRLDRQSRRRVIRELAEAATRAAVHLGGQQHVWLNPHQLGDHLVARVMQAVDANAVHPRLADPIPGLERADVVVLHEERGAEHVERVLVGRIVPQDFARERRGIVPPALRESHAAQLPNGTRRGRTLRPDLAEQGVGAIESLRADLVQRAIQPHIARVGRFGGGCEDRRFGIRPAGCRARGLPPAEESPATRIRPPSTRARSPPREWSATVPMPDRERPLPHRSRR